MLPLDQGTLQRLSADSPDWVAELRAAGFERYESMEMPSPAEEVWRYVELDFELADFGLADGPGPTKPADPAVAESFGDLAGMAVIVDGYPVAVTGCAEEARGAVFAAQSSAWREHEDKVRATFGRGIAPDLDLFAAAHHAFGGDGVFIWVPDGMAIEGPLLIEVQAATEGVASFPRITAVLGENSQASIVVHYRSRRDESFVVVPQLEADVGDGGRLDVTALQEFAYDTVAVGQLRMAAGRDATIKLGEVGLGGKLARLHMTLELGGPGSHGELAGLYFGEQEQLLDYRAFMRHSAPHTTSDMFLKGAVEDEADSVFTGLIRIEKEAQRTNAFQTNRNLVLSDGAEAQSVPNLEILANDVKCGHGSAVGPLDLEQRYYLMSRGLNQLRADRLQVRGFFEEAIARLPRPELAELVRRRVNAKFLAAQREGRV